MHVLLQSIYLSKFPWKKAWDNGMTNIRICKKKALIGRYSMHLFIITLKKVELEEFLCLSDPKQFPLLKKIPNKKMFDTDFIKTTLISRRKSRLKLYICSFRQKSSLFLVTKKPLHVTYLFVCLFGKVIFYFVKKLDFWPYHRNFHACSAKINGN